MAFFGGQQNGGASSQTSSASSTSRKRPNSSTTSGGEVKSCKKRCLMRHAWTVHNLCRGDGYDARSLLEEFRRTFPQCRFCSPHGPLCNDCTQQLTKAKSILKSQTTSFQKKFPAEERAFLSRFTFNPTENDTKTCRELDCVNWYSPDKCLVQMRWKVENLGANDKRKPAALVDEYRSIWPTAHIPDAKARSKEVSRARRNFGLERKRLTALFESFPHLREQFLAATAEHADYQRCEFARKCFHCRGAKDGGGGAAVAQSPQTTSVTMQHHPQQTRQPDDVSLASSDIGDEPPAYFQLIGQHKTQAVTRLPIEIGRCHCPKICSLTIHPEREQGGAPPFFGLGHIGLFSRVHAVIDIGRRPDGSEFLFIEATGKNGFTIDNNHFSSKGQRQFVISAQRTRVEFADVAIWIRLPDSYADEN